jgi:hypothetical protein
MSGMASLWVISSKPGRIKLLKQMCCNGKNGFEILRYLGYFENIFQMGILYKKKRLRNICIRCIKKVQSLEKQSVIFVMYCHNLHLLLLAVILQMAEHNEPKGPFDCKLAHWWNTRRPRCIPNVLPARCFLYALFSKEKKEIRCNDSVQTLLNTLE